PAAASSSGGSSECAASVSIVPIFAARSTRKPKPRADTSKVSATNVPRSSPPGPRMQQATVISAGARPAKRPALLGAPPGLPPAQSVPCPAATSIPRMADVLIYADSMRSPELRHEIPVPVPDPFLYAERNGRRVAVVTAFEMPRLREAAPDVELIP